MLSQPCRKCQSHHCHHKRGGRSRAQQFTPDYQRWARSHVSTASLQQSGRKGARTTLQRYGRLHLYQNIARYYNQHPPSTIRRAVQRLTEAGISPDDILREVIFITQSGEYLPPVDIVVRSLRVVIEINGPVHVIFGHNEDVQRTKLAKIACTGYTTIVISDDEIDSIPTIIQTLTSKTRRPNHVPQDHDHR